MSTEKFSAMTAQAAALTTQLDSLADGAASAVGGAYDNGTDLNRFAVAELAVTFGTSPTANALIDLYMTPAPDGTNYSDGSADATPPAAEYVGSFQVNASTSAQKLTTGRFELLPCKVKFFAVNRTGQAFPASGSTVTIYTFNRTIN